MKKTKLFSCFLVVCLLALLFSGCSLFPPKSYTVTFDPNGGELVSGELEQKVQEGEDAEAPKLTNGRLELSWNGDWHNITEDTTVKAEWTKRSYTVIFDPNGGELVSGELEQKVWDGEDAEAPKLTNGRLELSWNGDWHNITEDTTVTAEWTKVPMTTRELAEYVQARTVTVNATDITGGKSTGSGFYIDSEGTIVTNFHVIDMAQQISVEVSGGGIFPVEKIVDFSNVYDLAILKIDVKDNPYLDFADEEVRSGEEVYAVGSALGDLTGSFTDGVVSSTNRKYGVIDCLQMTTPVSPGNSGGPLVNIYGEVVGINTASYINGENLNLAIKVSNLDILSRDKNWSVNEFTEWNEMEATRCWSPLYEGEYYYSLVNNYQRITDAECLYSGTNGSDELVGGYFDTYDYYVYEYKPSQYDKYTEYLKSVGFEYERSESNPEWIGTSYYYYNEKDGILLDMFILKDSSQIWIWPELG